MTGKPWALLIFSATTLQLAVATFVPGLEQFEGKAFGARLAAYPILMLLTPGIWWMLRRRGGGPTYSVPWAEFALIMLPFLVDVTGNTLNLYDKVVWWDDANHFANWALLCAGFGLLLVRGSQVPRWWLVLTITGLGALLAIAWELAEWYAFIRHGTELDTAYTDTLGDEALGCLGGLLGASLVAWRTPTRTDGV